MKSIIITGLEIFAAISSFAFGILWLTYPDKNYEPLFAFSGLFLVLADLIRRHVAKQKLPREAQPTQEDTQSPSAKDIELYEKFCEYFSNNDNIRFFKEHDFLATFEHARIETLNEFIETWDNAAHEFLDEKLELSKKELYKSACALGAIIAKNTTPKGHGYRSVKSDSLPNGPTPQWVIDDGKEINQLAPSFVERHENFIRLGRERLFA